MLPTFLDWLIRTALPFWAERGFDARTGRFHERLDLAGRPVAAPHRAMVQARQIYVFAHAAEVGWYPAGEEISCRALATLLYDFGAAGEGGSFAFSIDAGDGRVLSAVRDAYTHVFILLALAFVHRRTGEALLLEHADRILAYIDAVLTDPKHGGLFASNSPGVVGKHQNPLMHLLEACLFLEETAPGRGYLARGRVIIQLFHERLFRAGPGLLFEHFADDWSPHPDRAQAAVWEPGHHFEWTWLLTAYARLAGEKTAAPAMALFASAREHGIAPNGLIFDEVGEDLHPAKTSHRLWPHTEAIKAAAVREDRAMANDMAAALLDHFVGRPFQGGWIDHIDAQERPLVDYVPASSLYHLFLAGAEAAAAPNLWI